MMELQILRTPQVLALLGIGRTTLWRWTGKGTFPKPVRLGPRAVGWRRVDLQQWLDQLPPVEPTDSGKKISSSSDPDRTGASSPTPPV